MVFPILFGGNSRRQSDDAAIPFNASWYVVVSASRVHIGGLAEASFGVNNAAFLATLLNNDSANGGGLRCYQDALIERVVISTSAADPAMRARVFRKNGAVYDFVGQSEALSAPGAGVHTFNLATPIPCAMNDCVGMLATKSRFASPTGRTNDYETSDITTSNAFSTAPGNYSFDIDALAKPPFMAATGDSLCQGVNNNPAWNPSSLTGTITGETWHQLRGLIDSTAGAGFQYQNKGTGGTWANGAATGAALAAATLAKAVVFHYGVNDVATGRTWAAVEADMDTCKAALGVGQDMWVDEIIPWNNGNDTQAATIRTFNANYAAWCTANGAHLISLHDPMGQIRASTGQLDDIIAGYGAGDGVHLSQTGVDAMAALVKTALENYYGYL